MRRKSRLSLADVYDRIPNVQCKGLCEESCGPIAMSNDEDRRLQELGFTIPSMIEGVAASERGEEYWCPALRDGRCRVYQDRPAICRLWGATTSMPCPHGCTPPDALSQPESFELLALAGRAGGGMASRFFDPEGSDSAENFELLVTLAGRAEAGAPAPDLETDGTASTDGHRERPADSHDRERRRPMDWCRRALHRRRR